MHVPENDAKSSIQVIARMMTLLDVLARSGKPMQLKDLAAQASLHSSTTHRILAIMVEYRLAERIVPGTYRLGIRLLELGNIVKSRLDARVEALPYMIALQQAAGETVNLSVREGDELVYVERAAPASALYAVQLTVTHAPLHATAAGKVFLASYTREAFAEYALRTGLPRCTASTRTEIGDLEGELDAVRRDGCAYDDGEAEVGIACIAAGVYDDANTLVAALSMCMRSDRLNRDWAGQVRQTAHDISRALGCRR
jgi:DNA-binding IclR family transcriptional regulator